MVIYWDASAILSTLVEDKHSSKAQKWIKKKAIHLLSSLADAEVHAVLKRMKHDKSLKPRLYDSVLDAYFQKPFRRINTQPDWKIISELSSHHVLKGADLWHLATVKTIQQELPEVKMITFDKQLSNAGEAENLLNK